MAFSVNVFNFLLCHTNHTETQAELATAAATNQYQLFLSSFEKATILISAINKKTNPAMIFIISAIGYPVETPLEWESSSY